jgi:hypothetical protein
MMSRRLSGFHRYRGVGYCGQLAVLASLLLLMGCGAAVPNSGAQSGTVAGLVEFRGCGGAPVDSPTPCIFRPMAGARIDFGVGGQIVTRAVSDAGGRYSVSVAPGTYRVHVAVVQSSAITDDSRTVKVEPGQHVVADFHLTFQAL